MNTANAHPRPSPNVPCNEVWNGLGNGQQSEPECDTMKYSVIN